MDKIFWGYSLGFSVAYLYLNETEINFYHQKLDIGNALRVSKQHKPNYGIWNKTLKYLELKMSS